MLKIPEGMIEILIGKIQWPFLVILTINYPKNNPIVNVVRLQVIMVVSMKVTATFWDIAPCSLFAVD
jgi:hypothetical protein